MLGPAIFNSYVAAFNKASFAQTFEKRRQFWCVASGRSKIEKSNHRHTRLLRMCRERPCRRHTEKSDDVAPSHCLLPKTSYQLDWLMSAFGHKRTSAGATRVSAKGR